jgi:hypothetical protein
MEFYLKPLPFDAVSPDSLPALLSLLESKCSYIITVRNRSEYLMRSVNIVKDVLYFGIWETALLKLPLEQTTLVANAIRKLSYPDIPFPGWKCSLQTHRNASSFSNLTVLWELLAGDSLFTYNDAIA